MGNSLNTKKMMANSLKELIQEMPFSKITIDKIVTNCGCEASKNRRNT